LTTIVDRLLDMSGAPGVVDPAELTDSTKSDYDRWVAMVQWWVERMRTTATPLQEKMTLFWHGHFVSGTDKVDAVNLWKQNQLYRSLGMGSFRTLTHAVSTDAAMLLYLDNWQNVKTSVNENWARELMELFTLGVNQYTQDDIVASAHAWTGHGLNSSKTAYEFHATKHDTANKTFFGVTKNWDGPDIIDEILTGASKPTAARFIANKLWSFFAYPNPEASVSDALTAAFLASNDLDVSALLRAIFLQPEFYSAAARGALVRTPVEFVVAALRYTGLSAAAGHPEWYLEGMGQRLFEPPNVAGWPQNAYWLSSPSTWSRETFVRYITWKARDAGVLSEAVKGTAAFAVQKAMDLFGITQPSPATVATLQGWLAGERSANGNYDQPNLITLTLLTPDFQLS
jgi:uncharacterized protein (DUF1800 family)